jgi:outer membrane immunogenic protein
MAMAQVSSKGTYSGDTALIYHWVRSNTQPGDCGCFNLNGGAISASLNLRSRWSSIAEVSAELATGGPGTGNSLTVVSYLAGMRYSLPNVRLHHFPVLQPFAQVLAGAGHAGGGIAGAADGTYAFVGRVGGGIDLPMKAGFALRLVQADYDANTFTNAINDHQNNLLLGTGIVYHWSREGSK